MDVKVGKVGQEVVADKNSEENEVINNSLQAVFEGESRLYLVEFKV